MLRRLVLVGLMVLMSGTQLQIILGTLFSAIFLLLQVQAAPFVALSDNFLAATSSFCLVVVFLCSYAFKDAALVDLPDIQSKLSREQKRTYMVDPVVLSAILIGALFGSLVISFGIFLITLGQERKRQQREARAAKARRLRQWDSNDEAKPEPNKRSLDELIRTLHPHTNRSKPTLLPNDGPFHVFLSHNHFHGQSVMRIVKTRLCEMVPECVAAIPTLHSPHT